MAKLKTFIKDFPELVKIFICTQTNISEVNCNNASVKTTIILMAFHVSVIICNVFRCMVWCQERATTHARVTITFIFQHFLLRNIVWNHSLSCTLSSQLGQVIILRPRTNVIFFKDIQNFRERRSYPNTLFILDTFNSLFQDLFNQDCEVVFFLLCIDFIKIQEN